MDFETIKTSLIAFFTTGAGATVIAIIITAVKDYAKAKLTAKATKLNDLDKDAIAEKVVNALKGKISVDMITELDKATRNLITEFKETLNQQIKKTNDNERLLYAVAKVMSQFKTVQGTTALDELNKVLASTDIEEIKELPTDTISVELTDKTETANKAKVSY